MHNTPVTSAVRALALAAVFGLARSVPLQQQQQQQQQPDDGAGVGWGTVLWSALEDCWDGGDSAVCLKTKALTVLDRALSKPTVTVADGVVLSARAGKSLHGTIDPHAEKADRAALDAVNDTDRKNAMLDEMLATRMDRLVSSRSIVLEGPAGEEGKMR